jgi:hypothetical protein
MANNFNGHVIIENSNSYLNVINCYTPIKSSVTKLTIGDIRELSMNAFTDCEQLTDVTFADDCCITNLPSRLFMNCPKLQSITIPYCVQQIGPLCFANCTSLSNVTFTNPSRSTRIYSNAFLDCPLGDESRRAIEAARIPNDSRFSKFKNKIRNIKHQLGRLIRRHHQLHENILH